MNITFIETRKKAVDGDMAHYPIAKVTISDEAGELKALLELKEPTPERTASLDRQLLAYIRMNSLDGAKPPCFKPEVIEGNLVITDDIKQALDVLVFMKLLNQQTVKEAMEAHPELNAALERNSILVQKTSEIVDSLENAETLLSPAAAMELRKRVVDRIRLLEDPPAPAVAAGVPRGSSS